MKFTVKRILSTFVMCLMTVIIITGLSTDYVRAASDSEYIRIGIKYANGGINQYEAVFDSGVRLGTGDNSGFTELADFEDINSVVVSMESGSIRVTGVTGSGENLHLNDGLENANCIMPYDSSDGIVNLGGTKYRGGIMFNTASGSLNIINYLPIEQYLYGVINGELNKAHPMEALKAQAVVARSYAVCKLGTHNSYGFDLCSTTHCQVYKGYSDEYSETTKAVDETSGDVIYYDDKPVAGFFYKNSGGYTQAGEDVWISKTGYLKAVKDEYSPVYPWSQTYSFSELSDKLSAAGQNIGTVTSISIIKRNQSGAVDTLQFTGTGGTTTLQKEKIRNVLGATAVKSTMFSFGQGGNAGSTGSEENVSGNFTGAYGMSQGQSSPKKLDDKLYAVDAAGNISKIKTNDMYVHNGQQTKTIEDMIKNSEVTSNPIVTGVETASGGSVTFTGVGYGHGVGMPQDSAIEMAKQGFTYKEILEYYYTDITID